MVVGPYTNGVIGFINRSVLYRSSLRTKITKNNNTITKSKYIANCHRLLIKFSVSCDCIVPCIMLLGVTLQVHCIMIKITRKVTPLGQTI
jgi:hypothetical protein